MSKTLKEKDFFLRPKIYDKPGKTYSKVETRKKLLKRLAELRKDTDKYEEKFGFSSEEIKKVDVMEFENWKEMSDWETKALIIESIKYRLKNL